MSKTILITGAGGQVSHELAIADSLHRLVALTRQQLEITDPVQIAKAFASYRPDILINAAAYTQVDLAESEAELAFAINRDGVANLAQACKELDIPMLHISTDYVFDGSKQGAKSTPQTTLNTCALPCNQSRVRFCMSGLRNA